MHKTVIAVAGAGSVGAYYGTILAHQGEKVVFLGRGYFLKDAAEYGLTATDHEGRLCHLSPNDVTASDDTAILSQADIILVTVKSRDTATMAEAIARYAKPTAVVISLQNGVANVPTLRQMLPDHRVIAGMVPYNVVSLGRGQFRRATAGNMMLDVAAEDLALIMGAPDHPIELSDDIAGVLWGKLLVNLNNALVALSNLPLAEELSHSGWRRVLAKMQREGLLAMKAKGIIPRAATPLPPRVTPYLLRLPTPLFKLVAGNNLKVDKTARSSMWEDLQKGRPTEVDFLQGQIVRLADEVGTKAPTCRAVMAAIKQAEAAGNGSPGIGPDVILSAS